MDVASSATIRSLNFDGSIKKSWSCDFLGRKEQMLEFRGTFDADISHPDLGLITRGTLSYEYYWLDRWYNVFRFEESTGELRNYYCNVNMPPTFDGSVLEYVDLDLDLLIWPDGKSVVLDRNEFEINSRKFSYPETVKISAETALAELLLLSLSDKFLQF